MPDGTLSLQNKKDIYFGCAIGCWAFAALILLCVMCNWKNIKIGIAVMKATAMFVAFTP